jgi:hypothetical protein
VVHLFDLVPTSLQRVKQEEEPVICFKDWDKFHGEEPPNKDSLYIEASRNVICDQSLTLVLVDEMRVVCKSMPYNKILCMVIEYRSANPSLEN